MNKPEYLKVIVNNERSVDAGGLLSTDGKTTGGHLDGFHAFMMAGKGLQPNTAENYRRVVAKFLRDVGTDRPTVRQIETEVLKLRMAGKSHSHISNVMRSVEHYQTFMGSPVSLTRPRKPKRLPPEPLTEAEVAVILSHCVNSRELAILALLATSGIRNEEVCNLAVGDIDFATSRLHIREGKGLKDRIVNFDGQCIPILQKYLAEYPREKSDPLFTTLRDGKPYTTTAVRRLVKRVVKRTRIKKRVYPHLFRHSLATNLIGRGAHVRAVQHQLGHSFIETTMLYIETSPEYVQRQFNAFKPSYL